MSYIPRLKYVFVMPRVYQMEWHMPFFRYMNNLGMTPRILAGDENVIKNLNDNSISFKLIRELPEDYDILLSTSSMYLPFGRYWLEKSMRKGKINVFAVQVPIPYYYESVNFKPMTTKFLHAVCATDERTINNVKRLNKEVLYLNTGYTVYDQFSTDEFKREVADVKNRFGEKLLIVTVDRIWPEEFSYIQKAIHLAESLGFTVMLQAHHGLEDRIPEDFAGYVNPGLNRFALYAAASHLIAFIVSSVVSECMYLGSKIGCKPLGTKDGVWGQWRWFDNAEQWYQHTLPYCGKEYLDMAPLIHDETSLTEFLSSTEKPFTKEDVLKFFGWPQVDSFTENTFKMIEMYFGDNNRENVKKILKKSEVVRGMTEFFGWECERAGTPIKHINDPAVLVKGGLDFLKQGNIGAAFTCLRIADKFSGMDFTEIIQYALANCHYLTNNIEEARKYIYRTLLFNPDCKEYQNLRKRIDVKRESESKVCF